MRSNSLLIWTHYFNVLYNYLLSRKLKPISGQNNFTNGVILYIIESQLSFTERNYAHPIQELIFKLNASIFDKYKSFIYAKGLGLVWWIKRKVNRNKIETDAFIQRSIFILIWWSDVALFNFNLNNLCRQRLINQRTVLNLSFSKKILNLFMFLHCGSNVTRPCLNILTLIVADWKRISQNIRHINTR